MGLVLQVATKKLCLYFQAQKVNVLTDMLLRSILHKPDLFSWMVKLVVELSEFGLRFQPQLSFER